MSALESVLRQLVVVEGLLDFLLSVHHEGPVLRDGLVDGLSPDKHELASLLGVKPVLRLFLFIGLAEQAAMHVFHQFLVLIDHLSFVHEDDRVPLS